MVGDANFGGVSDFGYKKSGLADILWKVGTSVKNSMGLSYDKYKDYMDLDHNPSPFKGMKLTELLTRRQMDLLKAEAKIPGATYTTKTKKDGSTQNEFKECKYFVPKTVGFYQLRNTLARTTEPFNTYMFVSDANAPVPAYDIDTSDKEDSWWTKENALNVSNSIFMYQD